VIAVIGVPIARSDEIGGGVAGAAALAAIAARRAGAAVELVGKIGDDPLGDSVVLALGHEAVGHAALLRDAGRPTPCIVSSDAGDEPLDVDDTPAAPSVDPTDPARWPALEAEDVDLALRYLPEVRTIVVAESVSPAVMRVITGAAEYLGARLVVATPSADLAPAADLVLAPPATDDDGAFAGLLGELAAAMDRGAAPEDAFREVTGRLGVEPARP
jgi:sugar/nucleoside kinase (ribokinase family)